MDVDVYVHDFRSTEESVASYSYSVCVGSTAWDWSHRQIQYEVLNKIRAFQHVCCMYMYRFPVVIQHWCCSTTWAVTEATCIPLSEQTECPWQLTNLCTMLVLSNQYVKYQMLLSMQYGLTHISLPRQGVWSGHALTRLCHKLIISFALKTSLDLGKQTSSGVTLARRSTVNSCCRFSKHSATLYAQLLSAVRSWVQGHSSAYMTLVLAMQCIWLQTTCDNKKNVWSTGLADRHQVPAMQVSLF